MELFCKYKSYLQEFNYPNINSFSDDQIADIFSAESRCFLVVWLVKALNSQFMVPTDWSKMAQAQFADFFHECGFCSSSQKTLFVNGSATLTIEEQVKIFDRIFYFLETSSQTENVELSEDMNSSNQDLESFLTKDLNLFPDFGPLKLHTSKERLQKLKYYREQIQKLKQNIVNFTESSFDTASDKSSVYEEEHVDKNIGILTEQSKKLKDICDAMRKIDKHDNAVKKIGFNPGFGKQLVDCDAEITSVLQYFKDVNFTQFLNAEKQYDSKGPEEGEILKLLIEHSQTSTDIIKLMKNSNNC